MFSKERNVAKKRKGNVFLVAIISATLCILLCTYFTRAYIPFLKMKCTSEANIYLNSVINTAVKQELEKVTYDSLVKVTYNEEGNVKSILCDTVEMNLLKHNVSQKVVEELKKNNAFHITVPLVYISSNPLISNVGPKVKVRVVPSGSLEIDFDDNFTSSGINQTKHEINIVVKVSCFTYLSGMNSDTNVTTTIPVAHTIIVGDVPDTYTNVDGTTESLRDDVLNLL